MVVGDIAGLAVGHSCLSLITNEQGGILDDTVITVYPDYVYMVVNGATKHNDIEHFRVHMKDPSHGAAQMIYLGDNMQLLALQGSGAAAAVSKLLPSDFNVSKMPFMTGAETTLDGISNCRITRYV
jgi:aminomethyltransferase